MIKVGLYRYKCLVNGDRAVQILNNYTVDSTKYIKSIEQCTGFRILKYLDKNGQYRFFPFTKYYRTFDSPEKIGNVNKFITNILTNKTDSQNVGYRNVRKMELVADVDENQLLKLSDIYTSPRVYLYIGTGTSDTDADWLEVNAESNENIVKRRKANSGRIDITITLPESYSITML